MKTGTTNHPKFRSLQKRLDLPTYAVVGILESVWMMAGQFADDGDLSRFSDEEIGNAVDWPDDPTTLVDALVEFRWLDRTESGLSVHDWFEHCPKYVQDRHQKRQKRAGEKQTAEDCRRKSETFAENRGLPNPTQPDPTEPNQKTASEDAGISTSRKRRSKARTYSPEFERFWAVYWNKSNKGAAADAFDDALAVIADDPLIQNVTDRGSSLEWLVNRTEHYSRHRPDTAENLHASTYLNKQRWSDELKVDRVVAAQDDLPEMQSRFRQPRPVGASS